MGDNDEVMIITAEEFEEAVRNAPPKLFEYNDVWFFIEVPKGNVLRLPKYLLNNAPELKKGYYDCIDIDDRVHKWRVIPEKNRKKPSYCISAGWKRYVRLCGYNPGDEIWMVFKRKERVFEFAWDDVHNFD